jgi:hypothetical protein
MIKLVTLKIATLVVAFVVVGVTVDVTVVAAEDFVKWGPSVAYENGDYWGQSVLDAQTGIQVRSSSEACSSKN